MATVTQAMVDAAIEKMKAANIRLQRAVEKSPSDRTRRGQHISTWRSHEGRIHKLYEAYDAARDKVGALKRELRGETVKNPGPSALPSKWTPATVTRKGRQIQIRVGGGR